MTLDQRTIWLITVGASVFVLAMSIWILLVLLWARASVKRSEEIDRRLGLDDRLEGSGRRIRLWHDGEEASTVVPLTRRGMSPLVRLERMRADAGFEVPLLTLIFGLIGIGSALALMVFLWTSSMLAAGGAFLSVVMIFWTYWGYRIERQRALFDRQFVDALELAARSLRAGHPLGGAFQLIATEIPSPVGETFAAICQHEMMGSGYATAINDVAEGTENEDLRMFATSVAIQLESGGNLADLMERLAAVVRDRVRLSRRFRVLTAQTRFSKNTLLALPFVMFLVINLLNPEYMSSLYGTDGGRQLMAIAAGGLLIGAWMMNRLAKLEY